MADKADFLDLDCGVKLNKKRLRKPKASKKDGDWG